MDDVDDLRPAVQYEPSDGGVHLRLEVPVKQTRHLCQAEVDRGHIEEPEELLRKIAFLWVELRGVQLHVQVVSLFVAVVEP